MPEVGFGAGRWWPNETQDRPFSYIRNRETTIAELGFNCLGEGQVDWQVEEGLEAIRIGRSSESPTFSNAAAHKLCETGT